MNAPAQGPAAAPTPLLARADRKRRRVLAGLLGRKLAAIDEQLCKPGELPTHGIHRILILRTNHRLGNTVLLSPLLQELETLYPGAEIDILASGGAARILFSTRFQIRRIVTLARRMPRHPIQTLRLLRTVYREPYDLAIDASLSSNMGRMILGKCNARFKLGFPTDPDVQGPMHEYHEHCPTHFALRNVHLLRTAAGRRASREWPRLNIELSSLETIRGQQALESILGDSEDEGRGPLVLGLFANATGDKCYPGDWWSTFTEVLREKHPGIRIIDVLADHGQSQLPGKCRPFYSRDLRKLGAVISNLDGFISGDCGVMHLASAVGTPTLGLFSRDNMDKYAPYGGHNAGLSTRGGMSAREAGRRAADWVESLRRPHVHDQAGIGHIA